jgi:acyl carrier protein
MKDRAIKVIYAAIDALNEQLPVHGRVEKQPDTILLGSGGKIDSVGYINLIVLLEEKCQDEFGLPVTFAADSADGDPFRDVGTLADHICRLVQEQSR